MKDLTDIFAYYDEFTEFILTSLRLFYHEWCMTSSHQSMTIGRTLKSNFDLLIVLLGIAMFPFAGPVDNYYVSLVDSTVSGVGWYVVILAAFGTIILGLVLRIYRSLSGRIA